MFLTQMLGNILGGYSTTTRGLESVMEECNSKKLKDNQENIQDLSKFQLKRVLADFGKNKTICVEGTLTDREGIAVVFMEKTPFSKETIGEYFTEKSALKKEFVNDVYGSYSCHADPALNGIKTTLIYPATEQHINKYLTKPIHIIEETEDLYNTITLPFIEKDKFSLEWVYNILDHKKEVERIVFEDVDEKTGFVLLPDLKWNAKQTEDLYLLALVRPHGIKSLRDLTPEHLPLLKNVLEKGKKAIFNLYKIPESQLRIYLHYQPMFYHLHIHFNFIQFEAPGIFCERSHLLSSVINNIELKSDYYQKATLPFPIKEGEKIFLEFASKGIVQKVD